MLTQRVRRGVARIPELGFVRGDEVKHGTGRSRCCQLRCPSRLD